MTITITLAMILPVALKAALGFAAVAMAAFWALHKVSPPAESVNPLRRPAIYAWAYGLGLPAGVQFAYLMAITPELWLVAVLIGLAVTSVTFIVWYLARLMFTPP